MPFYHDAYMIVITLARDLVLATVRRECVVATPVTGKEAKDWASEHLWGNCSSLYTPFSGPDGDDIDFEALRALVRHCLVDLDQDGIWLTGGIAEFWSLTTDELKEVVGWPWRRRAGSSPARSCR